MKNQKLSVFFDTNSYRQIVLNKSKNEIDELVTLIKSAEKINNIEPISTLAVNLELSANLVEGKTSDNYHNCLESLRFLTNHCYDCEKQMIRIASHPNFQISAMIFGALPIDFKIQEKRISRLFEKFKSFEDDSELSKDFYEFVKTFMTDEELNFSKKISELIEAGKIAMKQIYPQALNKFQNRKLIEHFQSDTFAQSLAVNTLKIISKNLDIKLDEQDLQNRAYFLRKELPISAAFIQWILCDVIHKDIDMNSKKSKSKRWNWLWDYQISFLISQNTINKGKAILITSDQEIIQILKENNLKKNVMNIRQYLEFLKINGF